MKTLIWLWALGFGLWAGTAQADSSSGPYYPITPAVPSAAGSTKAVNAAYAAVHQGLYTNTATLGERWNNTNAWAGVSVQAIGNRLYASSVGSNPSGANYPFQLATNAGFVRAISSLTVPASGVNGAFAMFGFDTNLSNVAPLSGGASVVDVGAIGNPSFGFYNAPAGYQSSQTYAQIITNGTYTVNVSADTNTISWVIQFPGHTNEFRAQCPRSGVPTIGNFDVWVGDSRTSAGVSAGPVGLRAGTPTLPDGTIEHQNDFVYWGQDGYGQNIRVTVPKSYDSITNVANLVVWCHGCCALDENMPFDSRNVGGTNGFPERPFFATLMASNYIIASSADHGYNSWGNPASVADVYHLIQWVRTRYAVSNIFLMGDSMGGLTCLNFIASQQVQVAGYVSMSGVANLWSMVTNSQNGNAFAANVYTAYGTTNYSALVTSDPANNPASVLNLAGVPMQFYVAASDITVRPAYHAYVMTNLLTGLSPEISTVVSSIGGHEDPSTYQATNVLAFFQRCLGYQASAKYNFSDAAYLPQLLPQSALALGHGVAQLVGGKTNVLTTLVTPTSQYHLTYVSLDGTVSTIFINNTNLTNGVSFQIKSANASDTNLVDWQLLNP